MHYIVAGAGPAGVVACETIRKLDPESDITLVGGEPEPPYSRMAIPYLLSDKIPEQGTFLRKSNGHYEQLDINLVHQRVSGLDTEKNTLKLANGDSLVFDRLLIATGATPINPPIPGVDLPGVRHCWTLDDAREIAARARPGSSVVLMGAGFIGCIILESLVKRGVSLTVVERGDRMVPRMMDDTAGNMLKQWCEDKGIRVLTSHSVNAIEAGEPLSVVLDSGETLPADLVISATGVRSNIDFLADSGVTTEQGILVNRYLQTNHPAVYAAGDVAQGQDFSSGEFTVQAIQPTAVEHGRIAAINMVQGNTVEHQGSLNMNVLDTLGLISTSFGQWMGVEGGDSVCIVDTQRYKYLNLQFKDDVLVGISSLGHTENIGVSRGLIRGKVALGQWKQRLQKNPERLMEAWLGCTMGIS